MKAKILITGSCGFIFSNMVRRLVFEKYQIASIDKGKMDDIGAIYNNKGHDFYLANIKSSEIINQIFELEKPDIVIHGAAETCVDKSLNLNSEFVSSNVEGTQNIINACIKHGTGRLIQVSTDEVYGQLSAGETRKWTEQDPMQPRNPYSSSKAAAELLVKSAAEYSNLNYNIVRLCNNYGPRQTTNKLIPHIIKCAVEQKTIPIYGEGKQEREWMHVFDTCSALMTLINSDVKNETYNISSNQQFSNLEVAHEVCSILEKNHKIKCHHLIKFIPDPRKSAHDFKYSIDASKFKSLGWSAEIKFKQGLEETVDWFIDNSKWILK